MPQTVAARQRIGRRIAPIAFLLLLTSIPVVPQESKGSIDIHVTHSGSSEGVAGVTITLIGPYEPITLQSLANLYTPNTALTPAMKEQIDALIASAPVTISPQNVANAALRMENQLLGLPAPTTPTLLAAGAAVAAAPPQVGGITDEAGHYTFPNLALGRYLIRAQREGYFAAALPGSAVPTLPTVANSTITIDAAQPATRVDFTMVRGATVSGRVRDPKGQPLSGVQVVAYAIGYQNNREVLSQVNSKAADDRGEYRLFWLPPGAFILGVAPRRASAVPNAQDSYARTFFPGTSDVRAATRVKVSEGSEVNGIDIGVRGDATGSISGRIVTSIAGPNGQPAQAPNFFLMPRDPNAFADVSGMSFPNVSPNRTNGQFEIRGVLPGSYDMITTVDDPAIGQVVGRVQVDVSGGNLEDVRIPVNRGLELKTRLILDTGAVPFTMAAPPAAAQGGITTVIDNGIVTTLRTAGPRGQPPSTTPVPTPTYRILLRSMEPYPTPFDSATRQFSFDPSGTFVFSNVPEGRYSATVTPLPPNSYIADVRVRDRSVYDDGFMAGSVDTLEVTVSSKGAKVTGVVLDAAKNPVPSARVVLVPTPARRENFALYKTATSDAKGAFTITGAAPGDYKLFSWVSVPGTAYMNAEFMMPYEEFGKTVSVTEGASITSDVNVIP
jgi:hypothetical protein